MKDKSIVLVINGQVRGGKNNMGVTKTGIHYPLKAFSEWSKAVILSLREQKHFPTITDRILDWTFFYTPEDKRRRDVPAILDSVFHCLERAEIISDDSIIKILQFITLPPSKENAGMIITIKEV
jgi:Holliday junction resolvase RusA-like endonuclease